MSKVPIKSLAEIQAALRQEFATRMAQPHASRIPANVSSFSARGPAKTVAPASIQVMEAIPQMATHNIEREVSKIFAKQLSLDTRLSNLESVDDELHSKPVAPFQMASFCAQAIADAAVDTVWASSALLLGTPSNYLNTAVQAELAGDPRSFAHTRGNADIIFTQSGKYLVLVVAPFYYIYTTALTTTLDESVNVSLATYGAVTPVQLASPSGAWGTFFQDVPQDHPGTPALAHTMKAASASLAAHLSLVRIVDTDELVANTGGEKILYVCAQASDGNVKVGTDFHITILGPLPCVEDWIS